MSPTSSPSLRRYRAERLLAREFERLRGRVLASVRGRLATAGASLDEADLEACYAHAWQGLYAATLQGEQIASPAGWLVLVTYRRAIDECRARRRVRWAAAARRRQRPDRVVATGQDAIAGDLETERDLAAELDDRVRLRQLMEGLRGRLHGREREAATLCYLQGLSRSQAAAQMGVSEARMRKLMEGRGRGRPGVAGKVGALVQTISGGEWCEQQGSLMRALAYGVLDPAGERHELALLHSGECPACRAYVASLRGLAAALPPVPLPWALGAGLLARAVHGLRAGAVTSEGARAGGGTGPGLQSARALEAAAASGAAGAGGAAGGSWLLGAGPLGAKLAVGCVLALGVGAGCVELGATHGGGAHRHARDPVAGTRLPARTSAAARLTGPAPGARLPGPSESARPASPRLSAAGRAGREFGPEQALAAVPPRRVAGAVAARSAGTGADEHPSSYSPPPVGGASSSSTATTSGTAARATDQSAAAREFAPG